MGEKARRKREEKEKKKIDQEKKEIMKKDEIWKERKSEYGRRNEGKR